LALATDLAPGEYNVPRRNVPLKMSTPICDVPAQFWRWLPHLTLGHRPGIHISQGKEYDCWHYKDGWHRTPRVNVISGKQIAETETNLRRIIANIFYMLEETEKEIGRPLYVVHFRGACNPGCLNPRHMTFADHPRPRT
jgi:hypothetical protein